MKMIGPRFRSKKGPFREPRLDAVCQVGALLLFLISAPADASGTCCRGTNCSISTICVHGGGEVPRGEPRLILNAQLPPQLAPKTARFEKNLACFGSVGAVGGLIGVGAVLGMTLAADLTMEDGLVPTLPLAITAVIIAGTMGPLVHWSSRRLRAATGVEGSPTLRVSGWVAYGLFWTSVVVPSILGATGTRPLQGMSIACGTMGATSLLFFSFETLIARRQAQQRRLFEVATGARLTVTFVPLRSAGGVVNLGGIF